MKKTFYIFVLIFQIGFSQQKLDVYFDFDDFNLNKDAVNKINSWIAQGKDYQVTKLYGFCDWKGTTVYNDTLALQRVNSVYQFLIDSKIQVVKNIEIRGFGENFEQSKNQAENRRVTIIYQEKQPEITPSTIPDKEILKHKIKSAKKGDIIKLENIYFFNNSARVVPKSEPTLYELVCALNDNPNLKIEIQGHICCKKPNEYEVISTARARAIYNYLIRNKIDRKRMTFKGYGVSRPVHPIPEKTPQEEDDNRRVEIMILEN